jgi:hypothetical protein
MTAHYIEEFETVDLLVKSKAGTRGVDAFSLSLIKAERQIRKLVTHLVYQFPCFGPSDVPNLRQTLYNNRCVYFDGFEKGFDALYPHSVSNLIGPEYQRLKDRIGEATGHRNKIFHGQLTSKCLSRADLEGYVDDIRAWCAALANGADGEFHYDGFGRNSFRKAAAADLSKRLKVQIGSNADYEQFVVQYMQ